MDVLKYHHSGNRDIFYAFAKQKQENRDQYSEYSDYFQAPAEKQSFQAETTPPVQWKIQADFLNV